MLILTFDYTKADGSSSTRVIAPHFSPGTMYAGTDISELSCEDRVKFANALDTLADEHAAKVAAVIDRFDINHRYRQFKADGVSNLKRDFI